MSPVNDKRPLLQPSTLLPLEAFQPAFGKSVVVGAILGGAVGMLPAAHAQQSSGSAVELAPVVVEGTAESGYQAPARSSNSKFTAPLRDTPKSVTIITEELIQDRGATSLQDVLRTTPGITLGSGEGGTPTGDRPFIRGYEASTDLFIDGIRDYARGSHETFNLESVEVIKGPSSAYTGRGGTGGSINMVTKKPRLSNFFEGSAGIGTDGQYRLTGDGNVQFSESGAFRLNVMRMDGDMPGRDVVEYDRYGIAPSLAFGLGTPTRIVLSYSHIVNKDTPDWGIPFQNPANPGRATPLEPDRENFYGRANVDYRKNKFDTATLDVEHDLNEKFTVRNVTRWSRSMQEYLHTRATFDNCGEPGPRNRVSKITPSCYTEDGDLEFVRQNRARWRQAESLVNQTELRGDFETGALKHNVVAGLEFSKEDVYSRDTLDGMGGPAVDYDSFWNPNPYRDYGGRNLAFGHKYKDGDIKTKSIYVFDTIELNPQWMVNLGVRWEDFRVTQLDQDNPADSKSRSDKIWNYQAGLVYKPVQNGSIYLSYGTSSNPGGENLGQAGGADGPAGGATVRDLKPEKSHSWELGTKWDLFNDSMSLTAAVFQTDKTDARSTDPITGDVSLAGSNRVRGIELGASGSITPKWDIWAGYSYLDPKIKKYRSGNNVFDGNQIKFIAKNSATLWTTYKVHPKWTVGGGVTYVGKRFVDDANTLSLPSHTVYDAMISYDVNDRLSLRLNANNLSDERVYDASHVGLFANVGPGRAFMLTADFRYD